MLYYYISKFKKYSPEGIYFDKYTSGNILDKQYYRSFLTNLKQPIKDNYLIIKNNIPNKSMVPGRYLYIDLSSCRFLCYNGTVLFVSYETNFGSSASLIDIANDVKNKEVIKYINENPDYSREPLERFLKSISMCNNPKRIYEEELSDETKLAMEVEFSKKEIEFYLSGS